MSRRAKYILVAVVLAVGVGLAWQFRKRGDQAAGAGGPAAPFVTPSRLDATDLFVTSGSSSTSTGGFESLSPNAARFSSPQAAVGPATAAGSPQYPPAAATSVASATRPRQGVADDGGVPQLSSAYPGATEREAKSPSPIGAESDGRSIDRSPRLEGFTDSGLNPTHKVADGDTLSQLAQRYLGSAERWRELYEYNRDVLSSPELLPIGAELRIPTAPFRPTQQEAPSQVGPPAIGPSASTTRPISPSTAVVAPAQRSLARTVSQPINPSAEQPTPGDGNLVPVPSGPAASANSSTSAGANTTPGKLQRLPPVGRVLRVAPRTYVVQSGDTLNSIAEKVYGDGARENILLQANRNLVPSAADLRPGIVLVIPSADP